MICQLDLYANLREEMKKPYELYISTYGDRIEPVFSNIENEAKSLADEAMDAFAMEFGASDVDSSDFHDDAYQIGLKHYEDVSLMKYNSLLMWIATSYQIFEQQNRKFLYTEITTTHRIFNDNGDDIPFSKYCERGIQEIKKDYLEFGVDITTFSSWEKIHELRLLANVIKHGDGRSANQLREIRRDFFISEYTNTDVLERKLNTLLESTLNVTTDDLNAYCQALIEYWSEFPDNAQLVKELSD